MGGGDKTRDNENKEETVALK